MVDHNPFAKELARWGPGTGGPPPGLLVAQRYCRRLARRHYENFTVASFLLPPELRQPFCDVYAYCRWADDLADETGGPARAATLLDWWEGQLDACYRGEAAHPVFVALGETIRRFDLPREPLADLLVAFRRDQTTTRYESFDELLDYCRYSANPVGRLVLHLGHSYDPRRAEWSDAICTGLQLANFCQDVARDWDRGRIYLPAEDWRQAGYDELDFADRKCSGAFRRVMAYEVARAEDWLRRGWPLVGRVERELKLPVALFIRGGLAVLEAIRGRDYDVWTARPVVTRWKKFALLADCWRRLRRGELPTGE
ncbi:MAG TPA: squalene synthase HpnC [Thermoguttaceae bacterium]|nr:squalene synthase HpnC [Thermoguttaceae bacterium]